MTLKLGLSKHDLKTTSSNRKDRHMDQRPVFVAITSEHCNHCREFRPHWPEIESELKKLPIRIEDLEFLNRNSTRKDSAGRPKKQVDLSKYPADIKRWMLWYPIFILFTPSSWAAGMEHLKQKEKDSADRPVPRLEGVVFNGRPGPNEKEFIVPVDASEFLPPTKEYLVEWVKANLEAVTKAKTVPKPIFSLFRSSETKSSDEQRRDMIKSSESYGRMGHAELRSQLDHAEPTSSRTGHGEPSGSTSLDDVSKRGNSFYVPTDICKMRFRPKNA